jgi:hypothetical protein
VAIVKNACDHEFVDLGSALFAGTDGARSCNRCEHVEVLIAGAWLPFEKYLERRRSERTPPAL